jgi:DUF1707 SHOCT-like domain
MTDPSSLRIADADRERVIEELHDHTVAGRLTADELEERVDRVYKATTRADLDALMGDLPVSSLAARRTLTERKSKLRRRLTQEAGGSLIASGLAVGVWVAVGAQGGFWPAWVIALTMVPVLRDSWRLLGPGSDIDVVEARLQARHERRLARDSRRSRRRLLP